MNLEEYFDELYCKLEDITTNIEAETYNKELTKLSTNDEHILMEKLNQAVSQLEIIRCYIRDNIKEFENNE